MVKFKQTVMKTFKTRDGTLGFLLSVFFIATVFSFFLFNENDYFYIVWFFFVMFASILFYATFITSGIKIDKIVLISLFLIAVMLMSNILNLWKKFNFTNILMLILFNVFYQYTIKDNQPRKIIHYLYISICLFAIVFIGLYFKELISFNFRRLGAKIGNVNSVGFYFTIGFALSLYFILANKKYLYIFPLFLFMLLGFSTGSVKVVVNMFGLFVVGLILSFDKKKWAYYVVGTAVLIIILFGLMNIPTFSYLKRRVVDVFDTLINAKDATGSVANRLTMMKEGASLFLKRPFLGWGFHGYFRLGGFNTYSHNNFIELLVNFGLFGFSLFQALILIPLTKAFIGFTKGEKSRKNKFVLLVGVVIMVTQFGMVIIDSKTSYMLIAILAGVSFCGADESEFVIISLENTKQMFGRKNNVENDE